MNGWIQRIFGRRPATPTAKLPVDEAIAAARSHAANEAEAKQLQWATLIEGNGQKVWVVSESAIGSVAVVEIDDENGTLISKGRVGVR